MCSTTSSHVRPMACLKFDAAMSQYEWSPWLRCSQSDITGSRSWMTAKRAKPGPGWKSSHQRWSANIPLFQCPYFFCYYLVVYLFEHIILLISIKWKSHNYSPVSNKALPGTEETSLSSANSSSSVGGWCVRGQLETAAVSCSSNRIQTWIRPVTDRDIKVRKQRPGQTHTHTHTPCLYLYRHQTPAGHSPSHPHCWLSVPVISLANWQAAPPGRPVWMTSCISLQAAVIKSNIPQVIENPLFQIARLIKIEIETEFFKKKKQYHHNYEVERLYTWEHLRR